MCEADLVGIDWTWISNDRNFVHIVGSHNNGLAHGRIGSKEYKIFPHYTNQCLSGCSDGQEKLAKDAYQGQVVSKALSCHGCCVIQRAE